MQGNGLNDPAQKYTSFGSQGTPWMQENGLNKFRTIVAEVFVGDPVLLRIVTSTIHNIKRNIWKWYFLTPPCLV